MAHPLQLLEASHSQLQEASKQCKARQHDAQRWLRFAPQLVHMVADKGYLVISTMAGASILNLMAV